MATILEQTIADLLLLASNKRRIHFQTKEIQDIVPIADLAATAVDDPAITATGLTKAELISLYNLLGADVTELEANSATLLALVLKADAARQG